MYLKRFTTTGDRAGKLYVSDLETKKHFYSGVGNVGAKRDFNTIDVEGHRPDAVEKALSTFESDANDALDEVAKLGEFPNSDARTTILYFVALLAVRNPRSRNQRAEYIEKGYKKILRYLSSDKNLLSNCISGAKARGHISPDEEIDLNELKKFVERDEYIIEQDRNKHITDEFDLHDVVLQELGRRYWSFIISNNEKYSFITSDDPVLLCPNSPQPGQRLGFGLKNTDVVITIARNIAMIGLPERRMENVNACRSKVAQINSEVIHRTHRQVYAANDQFEFISNNSGKIVGFASIFDDFYR